MHKRCKIPIAALALLAMMFVAGCGRRDAGHVKNNPSQAIASSMGQNARHKAGLPIPPP
jgi:hypothetical protein